MIKYYKASRLNARTTKPARRLAVFAVREDNGKLNLWFEDDEGTQPRIGIQIDAAALRALVAEVDGGTICGHASYQYGDGAMRCAEMSCPNYTAKSHADEREWRYLL